MSSVAVVKPVLSACRTRTRIHGYCEFPRPFFSHTILFQALRSSLLRKYARIRRKLAILHNQRLSPYEKVGWLIEVRYFVCGGGGVGGGVVVGGGDRTR